MAKSSFTIRKPGTMRFYRPASGGKLHQAEKAYLKLLRRQQKEGETAWLRDALTRTTDKLRQFGIKPESLMTSLPSKRTRPSIGKPDQE